MNYDAEIKNCQDFIKSLEKQILKIELGNPFWIDETGCFVIQAAIKAHQDLIREANEKIAGYKTKKT